MCRSRRGLSTNDEIVFFDSRWAQPYSSDEITTFEEKLELRDRKLELVSLGVFPECCEFPSLETLGVEAKTRAIPPQHAGPIAPSGHEEKPIAREWITAKLLAHQC